MSVFKKKKAYEKKYTIKTTEDLGVESTVVYSFALWKDPSKDVLMDFISIITKIIDSDENKEDAEKIAEQVDTELYYKLASEIIIDCDIDGLDFSTPTAARESFENRDIGNGFLSSVLTKYILALITDITDLKNG